MNDNVSAFNAVEYDGKIKYTLPYYEEFYKQVIDVVKTYNANSLTWLDVGCGTGKMAEVAFQKIKVEKFVFCDCSSEMIERAKNRFNIPNVEFIISDVKELEFSNQFDVITAIQVNHYLHSEERLKALRKCYMALRTGGIFISFENFAPNSNLGKELYLERWKSYLLEKGKNEAECDKHIERYNKDYFPISLSEHLKVMHVCGFKTVEILWLSYMQVGLLGIK